MEKIVNPVSGKTWYWRNGHFQGPLFSVSYMTKELCLPVTNRQEALLITQELADQGITVKMKRVHNGFVHFPPETLIVYADKNQNEPIRIEEENLERLQAYIRSVGGEVFKPEGQKSLFGLLQKLFTKEK